MRLLVISDIHSNYEALKSLIAHVEYDEIIFLGDAVNYGPQPVETLDWIRENVKYRILGNHDNSTLNNEDPKCSEKTRDIAIYTMENITRKLMDKTSLEVLSTFKKSIDVEIDGIRYLMMHGSPYDNLFGYTYGNEAEKISADNDLSKFSRILIGHTHFPMLYRSRIINPGSCGMPRDGNPKPWYAVIDHRKEDIEFHRFKYNSELVREMLGKMVKDKGILQELISYY